MPQKNHWNFSIMVIGLLLLVNDFDGWMKNAVELMIYTHCFDQ